LFFIDFTCAGNYNAHTNADPPVAENGDREKDKNKDTDKDKDKDRTVAFPSEYSLPISIPFQSDNFQLNGVHEKSRDKGKQRNNSRSGSTATSKENVTLQKFVTLREANGPSDETDI